ncbi:methyl-accepting chemotaxis protein [uncultured Amphritea sp.]|uniref:methyl-accepting chemotaxis protein n=1 Tax=uncultured Amphritea sp. TaxID=981605 RepID=UPI002610C529|nr:methyl-accepting chemotaxis protein [uncultured Amphritea sp.]
MLSSLKVSQRLMLGFGLLALLLVITNFTGYRGISNISEALHVVSEEEAPLIDAANEMKVALMEGRNRMEEFKGATAVIFNQKGSAIDESKAGFAVTVKTFDKLVEAILNGGAIDGGGVVIATNNKELAQLVRDADALHNNEFQVAAQTLFESGNQLVKAKESSDLAMLDMEKTVNAVLAGANHLEAELDKIVKRLSVEDSREFSVIEQGIPMLDAVNEIKVAIQESRIALEEIAHALSQESISNVVAVYDASITRFDELSVELISYADALPGTQVVDLVKQLDEQHSAMQRDGKKMIDSRLLLLQTSTAAEAAMNNLDAIGEKASLLIGQIEGLSNMEMQAAQQAGRDASSSSLNLVITIGLISIVIAIVLSVLITRSIMLPLGGEPEEMMKIARCIADGDMTQRFSATAGHDSVYGSMKDMSENLRGMISEIIQSSSRLAVTAEETSAVSEQTKLAVNQQHGETDQVAVAVNEMSATTQDIAQNTSKTASAAEEAQHQSNIGMSTLADATQSISGLVEYVVSASAEMSALKEKSIEVGNVLEVIKGIAEQTNLLALNAAIEAARAGDMGRGFAVVADEVRSLSQRTQESASNINDMITSMQSAAESAAETMSRGKDKALLTSEQAQKTTEAFIAITNVIEQIGGMTIQVATASEEQSFVAEEVNKSITYIKDLSLQTSSGAEQLSGASNEVAAAAEELNLIANQFKV